MRVVSLLPSATELVCAIGAADDLVGISHECDFPAAIRDRRVLTRPRIDVGGSSRAIDAAVRAVVADALTPGGIVVSYVATTTQLGKVVETIRAHGEFTEPQPWETLVRDWHVEGLAVRPGHKMNGHTGFLVTARRMAPGHAAPVKKRRPAPGAYGVDYDGPLPTGLPPQSGQVTDRQPDA